MPFRHVKFFKYSIYVARADFIFIYLTLILHTVESKFLINYALVTKYCTADIIPVWLKVWYHELLCKPALANPWYVNLIVGSPLQETGTCHAPCMAFLPRFAKLYGTDLSAELSEKLKSSPPAAVHREFPCLMRHIFLTSEFTSVKHTNGLKVYTHIS
jgi:hypothetical protein